MAMMMRMMLVMMMVLGTAPASKNIDLPQDPNRPPFTVHLSPCTLHSPLFTVSLTPSAQSNRSNLKASLHTRDDGDNDDDKLSCTMMDEEGNNDDAESNVRKPFARPVVSLRLFVHLVACMRSATSFGLSCW